MTQAQQETRSFELWCLATVRSMGKSNAVNYAQAMAQIDPQPALWLRAAQWISHAT